MTIYEGITWGFIGFGIIFLIIGFFAFETKKRKDEDDVAMEEETFRLQISLIDEKILELEDYRKYVQDEMDKKHKELLFLYQMITEKEQKIREIEDSKKSYKSDDEKILVNQYSKTSIEDIDADIVENRNEQILGLKKDGYSEKEIAKKLEIGQGEVKLVLNLFG